MEAVVHASEIESPKCHQFMWVTLAAGEDMIQSRLAAFNNLSHLCKDIENR